MSQYDEIESFRIFGIDLRCTAAQHNDIWVRVTSSPEFKRFDHVDSMLKEGVFWAHEIVAFDMLDRFSKERAELTSKITAQVRDMALALRA